MTTPSDKAKLIFSKQSLRSDIFYNLISFGLVGISCFLINAIIVKFYDPPKIGIFNQSFVIFTILGQLSVLGIPHSVFYRFADKNYDLEEKKIILGSAFLIVSLIFIIVLLLSMFLLKFHFFFFTSKMNSNLINAIPFLLPGILFLAYNKLTAMAINGLSSMKLYALFNVVRFASVILFLIIHLNLKLDGYRLAWIISGGEVFVFLFFLPFTLKHISFSGTKLQIQWSKRHCKFGLKAFLSGFIIHINTRLDILMIGMMLNDTVTGIYSFAAMISESFMQLILVVMVNLLPKTVFLFKANLKNELNGYVSRIGFRSFLFLFPISIIIGISFPIWTKLITNNPLYLSSYVAFLILIIGTGILSGVLVFRNILIAASLPGLNSIILAIAFLINFSMNLIFIPEFGMTGAAISTVISMFFMSMLIEMTLYRKFGIFLFWNRIASKLIQNKN